MPSSASTTAAEPNPADSLLGRVLRVTLTDGRVIIGRLHALDWKQTIILRSAELWRAPEELRAEAAVDTTKRALGLVAIEARDVAKYEVRDGGGVAPMATMSSGVAVAPAAARA